MPWLHMPAKRPGRRPAYASLLLALLAAAILRVAASDSRNVAVRAESGAGAISQAPTLAGTLAYISAGNVWLLSGAASPIRVTSTGDITSVRWSPGGGWLLLMRGDRSLAQTPDGSRTLEVAGAWAPDDSGVAVAARDGGIDLVSTADGSTRQLVPAPLDVAYQAVAWSPDGTTLALIRRTLNVKGLPVSESVWLVQQNGGGLRGLVTSDSTWPRPVGWSPDGRWLAVLHAPAEICVSCRVDGLRLDIVAVDGSETFTIGVLLRAEWLSWRPDSSAVVTSIGEGRETYRNKQLVSLDLTSGSRLQAGAQAGTAAIQPAFSPTGMRIAFTRGPTVDGPPFTNLDLQHGYPDAIARRRIWLVSSTGGTAHSLTRSTDWAEESPRWTEDDTLLFVRWRSAGETVAPTAQLWLADTSSGVQLMLTDSLGAPTSAVGYYGELGWSALFSWRP